MVEKDFDDFRDLTPKEIKKWKKVRKLIRDEERKDSFFHQSVLSAQVSRDTQRLANRSPSGRGNLISAKTSRTRLQMDLFDYIKPAALGLLIFYFFIGPGFAVIFQLMGSINPLMWGVILVIAILIWRNR